VRGSFVGTRAVRLQGPFDLILLDPPYASEVLADALVAAAALIAPDGEVVLEHSRRRESPPAAGTLARKRVLTTGDSALSFYR
jgi:16S rRNA G966 N2-methylase RsmD